MRINESISTDGGVNKLDLSLKLCAAPSTVLFLGVRSEKGSRGIMSKAKYHFDEPSQKRMADSTLYV